MCSEQALCGLKGGEAGARHGLAEVALTGEQLGSGPLLRRFVLLPLRELQPLVLGRALPGTTA